MKERDERNDEKRQKYKLRKRFLRKNIDMECKKDTQKRQSEIKKNQRQSISKGMRMEWRRENKQ